MFSIKNIIDNNEKLHTITVKNKSTNLFAVIYPNLGASLQKLVIDKKEIINGIEHSSVGIEDYNTSYKSALLFPFPNRTNNGTYHFNNQNYELDCNETALNNALHGHIYNKNFKFTNSNTVNNEAILTFEYSNKKFDSGFPFSYKIAITYVFSNNNLQIIWNIFNTGNNSFPFGLGWHPYFKTNNLKEASLHFNAETQYKLNEKMIPEKEIKLNHESPIIINKSHFDDCFILNDTNVTFKTKDYQLDLKFNTGQKPPFLQIYSPPNRQSLAIEPMTCAPDCFNNKNGLLFLQAKKKFEWKVTLHIKI